VVSKKGHKNAEMSPEPSPGERGKKDSRSFSDIRKSRKKEDRRGVNETAERCWKRKRKEKIEVKRP